MRGTQCVLLPSLPSLNDPVKGRSRPSETPMAFCSHARMFLVTCSDHLGHVPPTWITRPTLDQTSDRPIKSCKWRHMIGLIWDRTYDPSWWNAALEKRDAGYIRKVRNWIPEHCQNKLLRFGNKLVEFRWNNCRCNSQSWKLLTDATGWTWFLSLPAVSHLTLFTPIFSVLLDLGVRD